jgi:hypothetical protein
MAIRSGFQQRSISHGIPVSVYALTGLALLSVWVSVAVAMMFAPDMVSGSQHEHLALVAWTDWIWGLVATGTVTLAAVRGVKAKVAGLAPWLALAISVAVVWLGVMLVSVFAPVFVTGTDPTVLPMAALGAPIVGVVLTGFICRFIETAFEPDKPA